MRVRCSPSPSFSESNSARLPERPETLSSRPTFRIASRLQLNFLDKSTGTAAFFRGVLLAFPGFEGAFLFPQTLLVFLFDRTPSPSSRPSHEQAIIALPRPAVVEVDAHRNFFFSLLRQIGRPVLPFFSRNRRRFLATLETCLRAVRHQRAASPLLIPRSHGRNPVVFLPDPYRLSLVRAACLLSSRVERWWQGLNVGSNSRSGWDHLVSPLTFFCEP